MNRNWKKRLKSFFLDGNKHILFFGVSVIPSYMIGTILSGMLPPKNIIPITVFLISTATVWSVSYAIAISNILFKKNHKYDENLQNLKVIKYENKKKTAARWEKIRFQMLYQVTYSEFEEEGKKLIYLLDELVENQAFTKEESVQIFRDMPQECVDILQTFKKLNDQQRPEMRKQIKEILQQTHKHLSHHYLKPLHQKWEDTCKTKIQNMKQKFGENIYIQE